MELLEMLREKGMDVDRPLTALGGKVAFYEKLLFKFCDLYDTTNLSVEFHLDELEKVKTDVHTLKGTAGNLGLTPLFKGYEKAMELLRADCIEEARNVISDTIAKSDELILFIKEYRYGQEGDNTDRR